eukprot:CAMPEP_0184860712 /NCGR_PEP_ID=MMETSP0580-20130426/5551_1 /TAXON_ID=1118495 /ORGANISM="Dactyliosolen fragilissimus" /LENGTH=341 /DNA_ID=CAMNT_0027357925 /DNA_START=161 /DNA_END=1186 /DNA_ORIENTATION=-
MSFVPSQSQSGGLSLSIRRHSFDDANVACGRNEIIISLNTFEKQNARYYSNFRLKSLGEPTLMTETKNESEKEKNKSTSRIHKKKRRKVGKSVSHKLKGTKKNAPKTTPKDLQSLKSLKLGSSIDGWVASITPFGAFIKTSFDFKGNNQFGYALLHKSQISDKNVKHVSDFLQIGQHIQNMRVITIDYEKGEVGLSLRRSRAKRRDISDIKVGDEIEGKVTSVASYGAFVDIGVKVNALLHISRITQDKIKNIRDWVNEGDIIKIHIIAKDERKKTLAASLLDSDADDYLNWRLLQKKKLKERSLVGDKRIRNVASKSNVDFLEDSVKELEDVFGTWSASK